LHPPVIPTSPTVIPPPSHYCPSNHHNVIPQGNIEVTVSQGRVVWQHGRLNVTRGAGRFVPMRPFGPLFHGLQARDAARLQSYSAPVRRDGDRSAADP
ncbi:unnamed protein product, partial [Closterium sp. Yama58-4]